MEREDGEKEPDGVAVDDEGGDGSKGACKDAVDAREAGAGGGARDEGGLEGGVGDGGERGRQAREVQKHDACVVCGRLGRELRVVQRPRAVNSDTHAACSECDGECASHAQQRGERACECRVLRNRLAQAHAVQCHGLHGRKEVGFHCCTTRKHRCTHTSLLLLLLLWGRGKSV